jgi:hypothetical protein
VEIRIQVADRQNLDMLQHQMRDAAAFLVITMKTFRLLAATPVTAFLLMINASAADLSGRWEGQAQGPDGGSMTVGFNFKFEGEKVSGSVESPNGSMPFTDGQVKGDEFSFKVDFNGMVIDHQCKVSGDTISMIVAFGPEGGMEMKLKRAASVPPAAATTTPAAAPTAAADPTGTWKWSITPPNSDQSFEASVKLAMNDGKLTGIYTGRMGEAPISDATFSPDGAIAFSVVRERDGMQFVIKYAGKLAGDAIKGSFEFPGFGGGDPMKMDWNATRAK